MKIKNEDFGKKFWSDGVDFITPQCNTCMHNFRDLESKKIRCAAFPDGIPREILFRDFDHTKKHPDQKNEIVYEIDLK